MRTVAPMRRLGQTPAFLASLAALALLSAAPARADRDGHGLQVQLVHPGESIQAAIDRGPVARC